MPGTFRQYSWIANLVGVLLCSFFIARITSVYLGKILEIRRSIGVLSTSEAPSVDRGYKNLSDYDIIVTRNMFDSTEAKVQTETKEDVVKKDTTVSGKAVLTKLNIRVLGVLVVGDGRDNRSSATISSGGSGRRRGGAAKVYAVGDEESFAPNTKLTLVQPDRIEFVHGNQLEYAEVGTKFASNIFAAPTYGETSSEGKASSSRNSLIKGEGHGKFVVDKSEIDNAIQNLDRLYTQIRAVPSFSGNRVSGMKILSVKRGSIFSKLGLRRGDVLKKINGMELDVRKGFEIFNALKGESHLSLDLMRGGQPTTLEYDIR